MSLENNSGTRLLKYIQKIFPFRMSLSHITLFSVNLTSVLSKCINFAFISLYLRYLLNYLAFYEIFQFINSSVLRRNFNLFCRYVLHYRNISNYLWEFVFNCTLKIKHICPIKLYLNLFTSKYAS